MKDAHKNSIAADSYSRNRPAPLNTTPPESSSFASRNISTAKDHPSQSRFSGDQPSYYRGFGSSDSRYPSSNFPGVPFQSSSYISADRIGCLTAVRMSASAKLSRYFRRLIRFKQMDFEFALWQMIFLLVQPQKVYRNFMYRKKTKDQWARDDPAFLVLLAIALTISSVIFALVIGLSFGGFIKFILWVVFVDCIAAGLVIATVDIESILTSSERPRCGMGLLFRCPFERILSDAHFPSCHYADHIFAISLFAALPILKNTHIFLYPITFIFIFYIATITAGWNISRTAMSFYHFRAEKLKSYS
ncbi:unnamed protein product [Anisakis simplex]|uniref:Protein unc-50 homolog n=1 Tax=Anisakis simplex TaxID=6269 RepID=A0A0M3K4F5_ANISI|nr:unnamed protein product [Anisakis simplex]